MILQIYFWLLHFQARALVNVRRGWTKQHHLVEQQIISIIPGWISSAEHPRSSPWLEKQHLRLITRSCSEQQQLIQHSCNINYSKSTTVSISNSTTYSISNINYSKSTATTAYQINNYCSRSDQINNYYYSKINNNYYSRSDQQLLQQELFCTKTLQIKKRFWKL